MTQQNNKGSHVSNHPAVSPADLWEGIRRWARQYPSGIDLFFLSLFVVIITLQPFYLHGELNLFELGLYLPAIDAVLHGQVPFRDFFYLRGPFELYMPAVLMKILGENVKVLSAYFYFGNVLALLSCLWIGKELFRSRGFLYLLAPVLVARAFPRVVFTYWGGMRYVLGLWFVYCAVRFFNSRKSIWALCAGIFSGLCVMTSVEIGVCAMFAMGMAFSTARLFGQRKLGKSVGFYLAGLSLVLGAFGVYMVLTGSLAPFIDCVYAVVFKSHPTFATYLSSSSPKNLPEFLKAMMPGTKNFKYMTPMYLYAFIGFYYGARFRGGWPRPGIVRSSVWLVTD